MTTIVKSKASNKPYVQAQVRVRPGILHIQVPLDEQVNRSYGLTFDIPLSEVGHAGATAILNAQSEPFSNEGE